MCAACLEPPRQLLTGSTLRSSFQSVVGSSPGGNEWKPFGGVQAVFAPAFLEGSKNSIRRACGARTDNVGGVLGFLDQLGRHDHISVYRPERHPKLIGREFSPVLRFAQWILVADDE